MHNGKRSEGNGSGAVPNFIEYIKLKGLINVDVSLSTEELNHS